MSSPTLTDKVAKLIVQDILNGQLQPNEKLVVADLKQRYNVGASPIREALVQLSWIKYVSLKPQKGCWVAPVSIDELNDLYESLRFVSSILLKQAIEAEDESWELEVLTAFHKLSRTLHAKGGVDKQEWEDRRHYFHIALLEGARSKNMLQFFSDLMTQVKRYRRYAIVHGLEYEPSHLEEYELILKLVLVNDIERALKTLDDHLEQNRQQIEAIINKQAVAA